jgi:hypothetical protein
MSRLDEFANRHPGQRFLDGLSLYSLHASIFGAIRDQVPGFLTKEQERFERALASTASFGFFCRRALGFS